MKSKPLSKEQKKALLCLARDMAKNLTPEMVSRRWKKRFGYNIKPGTLANWRSKGTGPEFIKPSKAVFYPVAKLRKWERKAGLIANG